MIVLKSLQIFNQSVSKKGFTKRSFARHCGLSESTYIQISNGKQSPRPDTAKKICNGLGLDFDDIFDIRDKPDFK
ncbi:helix-turn-helix transcriptional regulator [Planococcus sp. 107-1]|uniref:helix-turn-helix transcriptional regulator n=1 Tax=Planococcus sp. 107-1 TaxID=2908840 RepID=UPI001F175D3B|nr:helix-turn-helix transcriptional regulator [Planococcus sp. 107-1]UJF27447.1 helix-turn-helix domain-containing protein [Planococcus sp. 107-1]